MESRTTLPRPVTYPTKVSNPSVGCGHLGSDTANWSVCGLPIGREAAFLPTGAGVYQSAAVMLIGKNPFAVGRSFLMNLTRRSDRTPSTCIR